MKKNRVLLVLALLVAILLPVSAGGQQEKNKLVLYAVHSEDFINEMVDLFEEQYPDVKVEIVVGAGTGEMMSRVQAEKGNPLGDVIWGGSKELYEANADAFEAVELDNDCFTVVKDPDHIWHATDLLFQTIAVNTELVSKGEYPETFGELKNPKWKNIGGIALANPRASGTGYSLVTTMVSLYDWDFMTELLKNAAVTEGSSAMFSMVRDGEVPVAFINEDLGALWKSEGAPLEMIYPKDGVSNQVGASALIKGGNNPEAAKLFINFLMSKDAQQLQVEVMNRRPARSDVNPPEGLAGVADLKLAEVDALWVSNQKAEILDNFDAASDAAGK